MSKIRKYIAKSLDRMSNKVAVFSGDKITVASLDFVYECKIKGMDIKPDICINVEDFLQAMSIVDKIEELKRVPSSLVIKSRSATVDVSTLENIKVVVSNPYTGGDYESALFNDVLFPNIVKVSKIFKPTKIFFVSATKIYLVDEFFSTVASIISDAALVSPEVIGSYGIISDVFPLFDVDSVEWFINPTVGYLAAGLIQGNESLYSFFTTYVPIDTKILAEMNAIFDSCINNIVVSFDIPEKISKISNDGNISVTRDELIYHSNTFRCSFGLDNVVYNVEDDFINIPGGVCNILRKFPLHNFTVSLEKDRFYGKVNIDSSIDVIFSLGEKK